MVLDAVAASLLANTDIQIEIAGYADSTGRKFMNLRLSQGRATAVRFYLARKGVTPARMVAKGYGASGYIAPNNTAAGRSQNRRGGRPQRPQPPRGGGRGCSPPPPPPPPRPP